MRDKAEEPLNLTFASRLLALRLETGLSIYALAAKSGISRQYIGELESGEKQPSLEKARKLAAALGKTLACWE